MGKEKKKESTEAIYAYEISILDFLIVSVSCFFSFLFFFIVSFCYVYSSKPGERGEEPSSFFFFSSSSSASTCSVFVSVTREYNI